MEVAINALRKHVNNEDLCDRVITETLAKGPKRIRIASREELKMEINKFKNISLRLMEEIKRSGGKTPAYARGLDIPETGIREEAGKERTALDHLDTQSQATSNMSLGRDFDEGEATEAQLIQEKGRLEQAVARLNKELKDKNNSILDLLETIEDLKIGIYSRDKAIELFRDSQEKTLNDLREAKKAEIELKAVWIMKNSLEAENIRLQEQLGLKLEKDAKTNY